MIPHPARPVAALAVLALPAALLLPGAAQAATADSASSLSIRVVHSAVAPGGTDVVTGDLVVHGASPAGRVVVLEARTGDEDGYTPIAATTSAEHGGVSVTVTPAETTRYRWDYLGDTGVRPSLSGVATVVVRRPAHHPHRLATSLSVRAAHPHVGPLGRDRVVGRLRSHRVGLPDRWVILLARPKGTEGWRFGGVHRTASHGRVVFHVTPARTTRYRLVFLGTPLFRRSHSGVVRIGVRRSWPTSLSVRLRDRGRRSVVTGALRGHGRALPDRRVTLEAHAAGATAWVVVAHHRTHAHGRFVFRPRLVAGTAYRVEYAGAARYAGSVSGVVRS